MKIRCGYDISYHCTGPTPMQFLLSVHPSRERDLVTGQVMHTEPFVPARIVLDHFGNRMTRLLAPPGELQLRTEFVIADSGLPDPVDWDAQEVPIDQLPNDVLVFLMGSRYADTDLLSDIAWSLFGGTPMGWARVQAIVDYVHERIRFDYQQARSTRTASEGHREQVGVCRDFAHLAVSLCRCMNIPARYCTGYLGDIGVPRVDAPMDFSAWFEAYLGGRWYTFDARHNKPRIGRVVMARGRDATDVAISTAFGPALLGRFDVITDEIAESPGHGENFTGHFLSGDAAGQQPTMPLLSRG
jgi:transglutaminase-like putative cysteine protease